MKRLAPDQKKKILDSTVKRLTEKLDVEKIILFGSFLKETETQDSDIDLLVMVNTKKKGVERYAMVSELLEPRQMPMDLIIKTPAEMKRREKYFDPFINSIRKIGVVLYEKKA